MRESRFAHQAIADDPARDANFALIGLELRRRCGGILLDDRRGRLGPAKLARKRIDSQRSNLFEFFLALLKLVARLKFQSGKNPFRRSGKYIGACATGQGSGARREATLSRLIGTSRRRGTSINSTRTVSLLFS